jgi:TonB family protein
MKWVLVVALALLLIVVCVVYLQHERSMQSMPPLPAAIAVAPKTTKPKLPSGPPNPVDITGPLKDRGLVHWVLPEYPEWALEKGITGRVRTKIWVDPAGHVKSFMEPQELSGEPRLDNNVVEALEQWQFEEKPNSFGDQWGVVTVRFSLLLKEQNEMEASIHGISLGKASAQGAWECVRKWVGETEKHLVYICKRKTAQL